MGTSHVMRCDACRGLFSFLLFECRRCGAEYSYSSAQKPAPEEIRRLACLSCGEPHEEVDPSSGGGDHLT